MSQAARTLGGVSVYADLVRYRELFANLFRRDFQAKYRGSVLGIVWSLVNPLALMGVFLAWLFGYIDWSRAIMVLVAIVGVASAPVIAATIFA